MRFHIGKTIVKIHPVLPFLWGLLILTGCRHLLLPSFFALALHEAGHILMACLFGKRLSSMEITPLGALLNIQGEESLQVLHAFSIAAAGPLCSLAGCLLSPVLLKTGYASFSFLQSFSRYCLLMALLNLLPALPLDGGRMLYALLRRQVPGRAAEKWLIRAGMAAGTALLALSAFFSCRGQLLLAPAFAGLYLLYAAALESKRTGTAYITSLIARRQRMEDGSPIPVEILAAVSNMTLSEVLPFLSGGKYHILTILAPDGVTKLGSMEEKQFCERLLRDASQSLADCIRDAEKAEPFSIK